MAKVNLPSEVLGWNDGCLRWLDTWQFSKTWIPPQPHKPFHVQNLNETKKMQGPRGFTDHTTHQQQNTISLHAEMLVPKLWSYCIPRNLWNNLPTHRGTLCRLVFSWLWFELPILPAANRLITVTWTAFKKPRSILTGCFGVHKNGKVFVYSKPLPE